MPDVMGLMQALQNRGGQPGPGPDPQDQEIDQEAMDSEGDDSEPETDPRALSPDGNTLFIPRDLFPRGIKVGDRCRIVATVTKLGAKNGVEIDEITDENGGDGQDEPDEDDSETGTSSYQK